MASSFNLLPKLQAPLLHKSNFLGHQKPYNLTITKSSPPSILNPKAKFNLSEILGGRGLCNGEEGLQKELNKTTTTQEPPPPLPTPPPPPAKSPVSNMPEDGFEKELLGLTGGFPGGEKGLQRFIEENPPPEKSNPEKPEGVTVAAAKKPKPPELPLLMPGMIAIVKNKNSPYYMYCGIVQRITDGKAGVLFEGGNWDRLISFRLEELERRAKGPPMVSPRSAILETMIEKKDT